MPSYFRDEIRTNDSQDEENFQRFLENLKVLCLENLANEVKIFYVAQAFHWNTVGKRFFSLHQFYKEVYEDYQESIDTFAEKIRSIGFGFFIPANPEELLKYSTVPNAVLSKKEDEQLLSLMAILKEAYKKYYDLFKNLEIVNNQEFMDFLTERMSSASKFIWMIESHFE